MSEVLSIRIRKELKEAMKKIKIDWRSEIEGFIERQVKKYTKELYLEKARRLRGRLKAIDFSQAEWIREDRDAR